MDPIANNPTGNKSIVLMNAKGEAKAYSAEEILAREWNTWTGWYCAAGTENLYITHDGCVFGSVCREGGFLGNVFDNYLEMHKDYVLCKKKWCMCGTDMALRKFKGRENKYLAYKDPSKDLSTDPVDPVAVQPVMQSMCIPRQVTWDLGRRCNYSCSYCPPTASNTFEAHRTWGSLKHAVQNVFNAFVRNDKCKFHFSGGEPTINPAFMDLVKWIDEHPPMNNPGHRHLCHVTTNGSRQPEYYEELIEYTQIGISVHFEFCDEAKLLETISAIVNKKAQRPDLGYQWFGVKLMVPPGARHRAESLMNRIYDTPRFREQAQLNISPIVRFAAGYEGHLADYEPDEKRFIEAHG